MKSKHILYVSLFALAVCLSPSRAVAQDDYNLDDQLQSHLGNEYFRVNALVQTVGRFSLEDDNFQGGRTFQAANARLSFRGNLDGGFYYRVFFNMVSEPNLLDAFVGYRHSDALRITAGAMKPRQSLDFIPDPGSHDFIDRARITGLLTGSREVGVAADGHIGDFYYFAGLYNGNRLAANNNNRFYAITRAQYTIRNLIDGTIQIGAGFSHGNSNGTISGSRGPGLRGDRTIAGLDLRAETDQFLFAAEILSGLLETVQFPNNTEQISGIYFTSGTRVSERTWLLARYQDWNIDLANFSARQITVGANITATSIVSFDINADAYFPDPGDAQYGISVQFQVQF